MNRSWVNKHLFMNPLIPFLPIHSSGEIQNETPWNRQGAERSPAGKPSEENRSSYLRTSQIMTLVEATMESSLKQNCVRNLASVETHRGLRAKNNSEVLTKSFAVTCNKRSYNDCDTESPLPA